ncbi:MAG: thermonuclease family protein [Candidatus Omnitrophica bacterium]|nr:thermonuclease family protein [Candidatus Omnitrophota bacterium]
MPKGKVTRVIDGDTFRIRGGKSIRLANVNAPELGTRGGARARNDLRTVIGGKTVSYKTVAKSYGRAVANVKISGRSVNQVMRNKGYTSRGR